ncbi:hypothetical protein ACFXKR_09565 [Streptomyces violascens]|uniref:hypothetical protein n=1 Tax=Streptomyces violascens TaxID=67381 RepID=UPI0036749E40
MGLHLTLCMADWGHLREIHVKDRIRALNEAISPTGLDHDGYGTLGLAEGWVWSPNQDPAWCAEYRFFCTSGSYKTQSRAGDGWDDMRVLVHASLRDAMDRFLNGLIWDEDPANDPTLTGGGGFFPPAADRRWSNLLLVCSPEAATDKADAWGRAAPRLQELRSAFAAECEGWAGRPDTFEEFTTLLHEWGDVVTEAAGRGWGLVGLP